MFFILKFWNLQAHHVRFIAVNEYKWNLVKKWARYQIWTNFPVKSYRVRCTDRPRSEDWDRSGYRPSRRPWPTPTKGHGAADIITTRLRCGTTTPCSRYVKSLFNQVILAIFEARRLRSRKKSAFEVIIRKFNGIFLGNSIYCALGKTFEYLWSNAITFDIIKIEEILQFSVSNQFKFEGKVSNFRNLKSFIFLVIKFEFPRLAMKYILLHSFKWNLL